MDQLTNSDGDGDGVMSQRTNLLVTGNDVTTHENGTDATFEFALNSEPVTTVVVGVTLSAPPRYDAGPTTRTNFTEATLSTHWLKFDALTWNRAQKVVVSAVDDDYDDGDTSHVITVRVKQSEDGKYAALAPKTIA